MIGKAGRRRLTFSINPCTEHLIGSKVSFLSRRWACLAFLLLGVSLTALDLKTGKIRWRVPLGSVSIGLFSTPTTWGSPNVGGPMSTGGGVTFIAATFDSRFRAFDSETGEELWAAQLPAPGMAVPMTFEAGPLGRQYVVIAAGGNAIAGTKLGDALIAYALPPDLADE